MIRSLLAALLAASLMAQLGLLARGSLRTAANRGPVDLAEIQSDELLAGSGVPPGLGVPAARVRELRLEAIRRARDNGESSYQFTVRADGLVNPSLGR